ncbi:MAG TPA: Ig-like domain-containing protein [Longimicrobium sp.]|nr:Ig-like domain-containing protein [Longimicrobium sp.]
MKWLAAACIALAACSGDGTGSDNKAGPPSAVARPAGDAQQAAVGTALPTPLKVRVTDAAGKATPNVSVAWAVTAGGGAVTPGSSVTDANGEASATWTLGTQAGPQTATATVAGLAPATFTATASAGAAAQMTVVSGADQLAIAGSELTRNLTFKVTDQYGNPVAGQAVTLSVNAALASLTGNGTATAADGTVSTRVTVFPAAPRSTQLRVTATAGAATRGVDFYVRRPVLIYTRYSNTGARIHELDLLSETTRALTGADEQAFTGALSPDGSMLAYSRYNPGTTYNDLVVLTLATGQRRVVYAPGDRDVLLPSFAPDNETLVFTSYTYDADGSIVQSRVGTFNLRTAALQSNLLGSGIVDMAQFGPDGRMVYVTWDDAADLFMRETSGATARVLNTPDVYDFDPAFLSASRLVHTCFRTAADASYDICSVNTNGTDPRSSVDPEWEDFDPTVSYDRLKIAFSSFPTDGAGGIDIYMGLTAGGGTLDVIPGTTDDEELEAHFGLVGWNPAPGAAALSRLPAPGPGGARLPVAVRNRVMARHLPQGMPTLRGPSARTRRLQRSGF